MSVFDALLRKLKSAVYRDEILDSLNASREAISKYTLPPVNEAAALWKGQKFNDSEVISLMEGYRKGQGNKPVFDQISLGLEGALRKLNILEKLLKEKKTDVEVTSALTYNRNTLIQLGCAVEFFSVYTRRLLNFIYYRECQGYIEEPIEGPKKVDTEWLITCSRAYWEMLRITLMKDEDLEGKVRRVPENIMSDETRRVLVSVQGVQVLDPLAMGAVSNYVNPFYWFYSHVAGYQAKKYKETQEEAKILELRALHLKKLMERQQDPKLQAELDHIQDRLTLRRQELAEMENDYGL